ncbi:MAG: hypothetical protein V3U67_09760 [Gemmatimonadota bacterium]
MISLRSWHPVVLAICTLVLASCSRSRVVVTEGQVRPSAAETTSLTETPDKRDPRNASDFVDHAVRRPLGYLVNPPRVFHDLFGKKVEAYNPTAEDDVVNSSWFTHRNDRRRMTPEEVARGPGDGTGPDTSGIWTVIGAKVGGITPGFMIRDAAGVKYLVKFDPPSNPELMTAAEAITQRLFYAAGYHTPTTHVALFDPSNVRAAEGLTFENERGQHVPVTDADLQELLRSMPQRPDGRIRAVCSRILPGLDIGPFEYEGTRSDDPADTIPHQHRRELRGLYVMAAWLNHLDTKQRNSLDMLVEEDGRRFVKHHLIDFGSSLGSSSIYANGPGDGVEFDLDLGNIGARAITAGVYTAPWERYEYEPKYPSIGFYAADLFDPGNWRNNYSNPAFKHATVRDGYWGAKLVASFDEEQIRAAVATGQLSNPQAEEIYVQAMVARRDLTVRYWFLRVTPLEELAITVAAERPGLVAVSSDGPALAFRDLAVAEGLVPAPGRRYEMRFEFPAAGIRIKDVRGPSITPDGRGKLELPIPRAAGPEFWEGLRSRPLEKRLAKLELTAIPGPGQPSPRSVRVYLLPNQDTGYRVVGRAY